MVPSHPPECSAIGLDLLYTLCFGHHISLGKHQLIGYCLLYNLIHRAPSRKISHHRHHSNHASMERDEVYVPHTRKELNVPSLPNSEIDWDEIFGDTPIYTLLLLIRQQLLAFPAYLVMNISGKELDTYILGLTKVPRTHRAERIPPIY